MLKIKSVLFTFILACLIPGVCLSQVGTIEGTIRDTTTKEVLIDAIIAVEGTSNGATTDADGKFMIEITPGTYTLTIRNIGYETMVLKNVVVKAGQATYVSAALFNDREGPIEVTVLGTRVTNSDAAVVEEVKNAMTIASGLSGDQISRNQDRDASEAVRRIAGVTVIENRFVMVRGLSERYNAVTLNNALTPSFEQDVKAFSFDIIPSQMIDRVLIYKAPAPELSGEFAGGAIKIYTTGIPARNSLDIGFSTSYRPNTTFKDFYNPVKGNSDWLGYNDHTNAHPTEVPPDFSSVINKYDNIKVGQLFRNDTWVAEKKKAPLDARFNLSFTRKITLGNGKELGIISAVNYSSTSTSFKGVRQMVLPYKEESQINNTPQYNYVEDLYTRNVRLGGLQNLAYRIGTKHTFEFKNLYNHQGTSQYQVLSGNDQGIGADFYKRYMLYKMYRGLYSGQLTGTHDFTAHTVFDWTVGYSVGTRDEPDIKRYMQSASTATDQYHFNLVTGANAQFFGRIYGKTNEDVKMSSGNLQHTFVLQNLPEFKPEFKAGWYLEERRRQYQLKVYGYQSHLQTPDGTYYNDANIDNWTIDDLNNPQSWNNYNGLVITKGWNSATSYSAVNSLIAYYGGINLPYKDKFNIYSGIRVENNTQTVSKAVHLVSVLPSVNATYNFNEKLKLRAAYGKTLNRPEFREVANFQFYDFFFFRSVLGNPNLKVPAIHNSEVRFEYYPGFGEVLSLGVFNKNFINPIERVLLLNTGGASDITFQNASRANSLGVEAEIKKSLNGLIKLGGKDLLKNISLSLNAALIRSEVKFDSVNILNVQKRPMMGQSPYIVNAGLTYKSDSIGLMVNLNYNVIGKRIFIADNQGGNVYEMPRNVIDLTLTKSISRFLELRIGIQDILNQRVQYVQDANADGKVHRLDSSYIPRDSYKGGDVEFWGFSRGSYYTVGLVIRLIN